MKVQKVEVIKSDLQKEVVFRFNKEFAEELEDQEVRDKFALTILQQPIFSNYSAFEWDEDEIKTRSPLVLVIQ